MTTYWDLLVQELEKHGFIPEQIMRVQDTIGLYACDPDTLKKLLTVEIEEGWIVAYDLVVVCDLDPLTFFGWDMFSKTPAWETHNDVRTILADVIEDSLPITAVLTRYDKDRFFQKRIDDLCREGASQS